MYTNNKNDPESLLMPRTSGGNVRNKFGKSFKHFDHLIANLPSDVRLPGLPSGEQGSLSNTNILGMFIVQ